MAITFNLLFYLHIGLVELVHAVTVETMAMLLVLLPFCVVFLALIRHSFIFLFYIKFFLCLENLQVR